MKYVLVKYKKRLIPYYLPSEKEDNEIKNIVLTDEERNQIRKEIDVRPLSEDEINEIDREINYLFPFRKNN